MLSYRTLWSMLLAATLVAVVTVAPAQAQTESSAAVRPTVTIVKRALIKTWDLDRENSVDKVSLTFRSLRLLTTRRAIPTDFVEGAWVTPVVSVIDQKIVTLSPNILTEAPIATARSTVSISPGSPGRATSDGCSRTGA